MSEPKKDGGIAFPLTYTERTGLGHTIVHVNDGMSLRDWFAGKALSGISHFSSGYEVAGAAKRAYELADAMLVERLKGGAQ